MNTDEARDVILDIFTEYLPKAISRAVRKEIADEILSEFVNQGALDLEDPIEEDSDELEPYDIAVEDD